jgi:hypothetical protein
MTVQAYLSFQWPNATLQFLFSTPFEHVVGNHEHLIRFSRTNWSLSLSFLGTLVKANAVYQKMVKLLQSAIVGFDNSHQI